VKDLVPTSRSSDPLRQFGICRYSNLYTPQDIAAFNAALDPLLNSRITERRAYVRANY
jgi:hypothetical protein